MQLWKHSITSPQITLCHFREIHLTHVTTPNGRWLSGRLTREYEVCGTESTTSRRQDNIIAGELEAMLINIMPSVVQPGLGTVEIRRTGEPATFELK
ncbi:unnamed protein product [Protopolystoma xenopodis]|uniref:Uncharacterized protein n=1 Tax=Protopolystoma xenopodis TaxID=117903 RepID=A0A448XNJ3_9PLAT|nr:unnamed protein product [Protopolystoma xenopodis]